MVGAALERWHKGLGDEELRVTVEWAPQTPR